MMDSNVMISMNVKPTRTNVPKQIENVSIKKENITVGPAKMVTLTLKANALMLTSVKLLAPISMTLIVMNVQKVPFVPIILVDIHAQDKGSIVISFNSRLRVCLSLLRL